MDWSVDDELGCLLHLPTSRVRALRNGNWDVAKIPATTRNRLEGILVGVMMMTGLYRPDTSYHESCMLGPTESIDFLGYRTRLVSKSSVPAAAEESLDNMSLNG